MAIVSLHGLALPKQFRRGTKFPAEQIDAAFEQQYDFHTLFYDAFYVARRRAICLICPALFNFEDVLKRALFTAGGESLRVSAIWRHKRFAEVWLRCAGAPTELRMEGDGFDAVVSVAHDDTAAFAGLNCAVLKSKNNELLWIKEWAEYHVKVHGLQGLVFFDNNSDRYALEDIEATLAQVSGLSRVRVAAAPYKFGVYRLNDTMFLQLGLLNIARLRFLSSAAGVICTDIDELIGPTPEGGVFASARASPLGYLLFNGYWRHAGVVLDGETVRHRDHVYRTEDDFLPGTKYCICPTKILGFSHWDIHGAVRGSLKNTMLTRRFVYWHCRQISTDWRYARGLPKREELFVAEETVTVLREVFA